MKEEVTRGFAVYPVKEEWIALKRLRRIVVLLVVLVALSGCRDAQSAEDVIKEMTPAEEGYNVMAFFEEIPITPEGTKAYEIYMNQAQIVPIEKVNQYATLDAPNEEDIIKALGIEEFPYFLVLDQEGVVLETTNIYKVGYFFKTVPES